jgi:hypothetical protein
MSSKRQEQHDQDLNQRFKRALARKEENRAYKTLKKELREVLLRYSELEKEIRVLVDEALSIENVQSYHGKKHERDTLEKAISEVKTRYGILKEDDNTKYPITFEKITEKSYFGDSSTEKRYDKMVLEAAVCCFFNINKAELSTK